MTTMALAGEELFVEPIGRVLAAEDYDALPENPRRELLAGGDRSGAGRPYVPPGG